MSIVVREMYGHHVSGVMAGIGEDQHAKRAHTDGEEAFVGRKRDGVDGLPQVEDGSNREAVIRHEISLPDPGTRGRQTTFDDLGSL